MLRRIAMALLLAGASVPATAETPPAPRAAPPGLTTCTMPRPQMCTQDYKPVCATRSDGTRRTYGNGCMACAHAGVVSHVPGPCPG